MADWGYPGGSPPLEDEVLELRGGASGYVLNLSSWDPSSPGCDAIELVYVMIMPSGRGSGEPTRSCRLISEKPMEVCCEPRVHGGPRGRERSTFLR